MLTRRHGWPLLPASWRRASLRTKIYLTTILLVSVPLLVVAVAAYWTATTTIETNAQDFSARLTGEIRKNLETYEQQVQRLTYWPFQAADVRAVLGAYQGPMAQTPQFGDMAIMQGELAYLGHSRADIAGIYVVTTDGALFSWTASGDLRPHPMTRQAAWYRAAMAADPRIVFSPTQSQELISVATDRVFSLVRALHDPLTGRRLGAVRVDLDAATLASVVQRVSLGAGGRLLVVTPQGRVVYPIDPTPATDRLAREITAHRGARIAGRLHLTVAGQALLVTFDSSAASGWMVAGIVPRDQLLAGATRLRLFILTVAILCILAAALGARLILGRLTAPLRQLRNAMRRVEARDLNTRIAVQSEDEVGQLAHGFNTMLDELSRLVDDVLQAQIHEREAELHALQNQINPHFLYNTLESINMLALTHGDRDISRMVTSLGRLLRLTISSGDVLITLGDEIDYVNHYLTVQRMRYGERIGMEVDVEAALLGCLIPKLTLQPLVENALYHGLEPHRGAGRVVVHGRRHGDDLVLTVSDDGVGMDAATLSAVQARLQEIPSRGQRSVGLANVQQRLRLHCGPGYALSISSAKGQGTQVTARLPLAPRAGTADPHGLSKANAGKDDDGVSLAHR